MQEADDYEYDPLEGRPAYRGEPLRAWQRRAYGKWEDNNYRGVVKAITGSGKSLVGVAAVHTTWQHAGKSLILVPSDSLLQQWQKVLRENLAGIRIGVVGGGRNDDMRDVDVMVATVQSASRREITPFSLGLLVADEAHRYGSEVFSLALRGEYGRRLALSGSYERQLDDGVERRLNPYFGPVLVDYGYGEARREKVVAPFRLALVGVRFTPSEQASYDRESKRMNEARDVLTKEHGYSFEWREFFSEVNSTLKAKDTRGYDTDLCQTYMSAFSERRKLQSEASQKEEFVRNVGSALSDLGGTLVFAETIDGAYRLAHGLSRHTTVKPLTSELRPNERADLLRDFAAGRLKAICTPRVLDEGVDVPSSEVAIVVATSKTRRQLIQRMGRVIRLKKDGRAAKLVILYVRGTGEDPEQGGHEAFLDAVMPYAEETREFDYSEPAALREWLPG